MAKLSDDQIRELMVKKLHRDTGRSESEIRRMFKARNEGTVFHPDTPTHCPICRRPTQRLRLVDDIIACPECYDEKIRR